MADITLKLIWYRLGESFSNMESSASRLADWYRTEFSWRRVEILDMLVLGWILLALVAVGLINVYLHFFGPWRKAVGMGAQGNRAGVGGPQTQAGETCYWLNNVISYLQSCADAHLAATDTWLQCLNKQVEILGGSFPVRIVELQTEGSSPKFTHITTEAGAKDTFTIRGHVDWSDFAFLVSATPSYTSPAQSCLVKVTHLKGQVSVFLQVLGPDLQMEVSFVSCPEISLSTKVQDPQSGVDVKQLERLVQKAVQDSVVPLIIPWKNNPLWSGQQTSLPRSDLIQPASASPTQAAPRTSLKDKRLLVKVIKASALGDSDFACCDAYCVVEMDCPTQTHMTSVVRNTANPFWDEHFLFDMEEQSSNLKFKVYDREKRPGEDLLGEGIVDMADISKQSSSRQIIPIHGPVTVINQGSSVTAEFLLMEPAEAQSMMVDGPKRQIATNRTITPGGCVVTTTTMTTEKPQGLRAGAYESPGRILKTNSSSNFQPEASPYASSITSSQAGGEPSLSSSQVTPAHAAAVSQSFDSPILTVTRASGSHEKSATLPMTESSPTGDVKGSPSLSTTSSDHKEKKKSFANTLRKRFSRSKKRRSHSADRATMRGGDTNLLRPPDQSGVTRTADDMANPDFPQSNLRKTRSHSFSNSLRRLFRKKKKDNQASSRESSISRASTRSKGQGQDDVQVSREGSLQPTPTASTSRDEYSHSREPSFTPSVHTDPGTYPYSTSVPPNSYLQE